MTRFVLLMTATTVICGGAIALVIIAVQFVTRLLGAAL